MKIKYVASLALVASLFAAPAMAADIDINAIGIVAGVNQTAVASALSDLKSTADVSQVIGLNSVEGNWTDDVNAVAVALGVSQAAQAAAALPAGAPMNGKSAAEITQVAGLNSLDLDNVAAGADINAVALTAGATQTAVASAVGTASAAATASQLSGVNTVSVNVN